MILMVIGAGLSLLSIVVGVGNPDGSFNGSFIVTPVPFVLVGTMLLFIFTVEDEKLTDLIKHCEKIQEKGWAEDLKNINSSSRIDDFNDLECYLMDNNLVDYQADLIKQMEDKNGR